MSINEAIDLLLRGEPIPVDLEVELMGMGIDVPYLYETYQQ